MSVEDILSNISEANRNDWKELLEIFALESDTDLFDVIKRLPVTDVLAIDKDYIEGKHFATFVNIMNVTYTYEKLIRKCYTTTITHIKNIVNKSDVQIYTKKLTKDIETCLSSAILYHKRSKRDRDLASSPDSKPIKVIGIIEPKELSSIETLLRIEYPKTMKFLNDMNKENSVLAISEMKDNIMNSKIREKTIRRREFRKAIVSNHDGIYAKFLDKGADSFRLHDTKLDRVVIDVYHPDLFTYDTLIKSKADRSSTTIAKDLNPARIPKESFIEALRQIKDEEDVDIDEMVKDFENERLKTLSEGYHKSGNIIMETELGKIIFTFKPQKTGAPIRLRLIANIQTLVQHELFREQPEKKQLYRSHTWSKDSEINFIMPEDYEYYLQKEIEICQLLECTAKEMFIHLVSEYLDLNISAKNQTIVCVPQWEVCYETGFRHKMIRNKIFKRYYRHPSLVEYIHIRMARFHKFANKYAVAKYETETNRHSFYCDIPSMDPTSPVMQYKIYPKFHNMENQIMIRHEMTATKHMKYACADATDGIALSFKVLSNPEYCRETIDLMLYFELYQNGVKAFGYNKRYREWKSPQPQKLGIQLFKKAIFGSKADKYGAEFQQFLDSGLIPTGIPSYYRKIMENLDIAKKKKHGIYIMTESFSQAVTLLMSENT